MHHRICVLLVSLGATSSLACSLERVGFEPPPRDCPGQDCPAPAGDGGTPRPGACGDAVCAAGEDCASCPADCGACTDACESGLAPNVDYGEDVQPIFDARCVGCHGGTDPAAGLRLDTLLGLLAGSASGPVITPCSCRDSLLWKKLGPDPFTGDRMPLGGAPLSDAEIARICQWLDEGAESRFDPTTCGAPVGPPRGACDECGDGVCGVTESCGSCVIDCGCEPPPPERDVTAPAFEGARDAESPSPAQCVVSWRPAVDDVTPSEAIVYEVFAGPRDTVPDLSRPVAVTAPGATSHVLAIGPGERVDVVVRAVDAAGNRDTNLRARECDGRD
ncbi:c-type cytochrome domain-containing protein [Sandaracinus amylolyticus]|uniref:Cytochrome c domain-containing protein n=1 Tax=Sandaracinus amylolyticus TaxID=927083 RepID=A0A0F6W9E3_9BACT|nr:c-type cytochrome domain-containing protein [Sandaracinus amylolyticus]AKF10708.1 hypothetical protein DB32_007857 [Sandaracinus amylolyticus]